MAKRSSRQAAAPKRSRGRRSGEGGFEVQDGDAPPKQPMSVETALAAVTFVALLVALLLVQLKDGADFGRGLFG